LIRSRTASEGLEDGEKEAAVLRYPRLLADVRGRDVHQCIVREGRKGVARLVGQDIAVGQEQDTRPARRLAFAFPVSQVPAARKQLPRDLEGDEGLTGPGGERQQDAGAPIGDRRQHPLAGEVLIIAALKVATAILEGHGGETVAPGVRTRKGQVQEFQRGRQPGEFALGPVCISMPQKPWPLLE